MVITEMQPNTAIVLITEQTITDGQNLPAGFSTMLKKTYARRPYAVRYCQCTGSHVNWQAPAYYKGLVFDSDGTVVDNMPSHYEA